MPYPHWSYFPRNERHPAWVEDFIQAVKGVEKTISTVKAKTGLSSDDVLKELSPGLTALGYAVESGKTKAAKISRPVLFGENGVAEVSYEIDGFHDQLGVAVEVEAGRGAANNADYRDLVRTSLILDAKYLAMLMPIPIAPPHPSRRTPGPAQLDAIYASSRLKLPFRGVLLVGY